MTTFLSIIKRVPWWAWVAIAVAIFFIVNQVSGNVYSRKLWNMVADQIREDQSRVVETLQENQKMYETEINRLQVELQTVKQQQAVARAETEKLRGLVREKDGQILALKRERELIVVPTDPNALLDEFRKRGYKPRIMLPSR